MGDRNLIPMYRRQSRLRRRLARRWTAAIACYSLCLLAAYPVTRTVFAADATLDDRLAAARAESAESAARIEDLLAQAEEARAKLKATRMVENQADWSVLLGVIVQEMGEDIVLRECMLDPANAVGNAASRNRAGAAGRIAHTPGGPSRYVVQLRGYGRTQMAVSQFVLRLERAKLFTKVTLEESRREGFLKGDAISFRLRCELAHRQEATS